MSGQILSFPKNIRKASSSTVMNYTNFFCHKIFLEEKIEALEVINNSHDILKHAAFKGRSLTGDIKFITLAYLNKPNAENWEALKDLKISNKKTASEVLSYYNKFTNQEIEISKDALLNALKYIFDMEFQGYKDRLKESTEKLLLIKQSYPSIDSQMDLN